MGAALCTFKISDLGHAESLAGSWIALVCLPMGKNKKAPEYFPALLQTSRDVLQ
jgi:hypothetical protein